MTNNEKGADLTNKVKNVLEPVFDELQQEYDDFQKFGRAIRKEIEWEIKSNGRKIIFPSSTKRHIKQLESEGWNLVDMSTNDSESIAIHHKLNKQKGAENVRHHQMGVDTKTGERIANFYFAKE